jgi:hypothetical protein
MHFVRIFLICSSRKLVYSFSVFDGVLVLFDFGFRDKIALKK